MRNGSLLLLVAAIGMTPTLHRASAAETTLHALFQAQAGYSEEEVRAMTERYVKAHPGITVDLEFVPYDALHDKAVLAKGSSNGYDVILSDLPFNAEYVENDVIDEVTARITPAMRDGILGGAMSAATYKGKYYGLPWIIDAKFLFYNKIMFAKAGIAAPPRSWAELEADAVLLKQKGIVEYPLVASWRVGETLTADYGTVLAGFGGKFIDAAGKPAFQTGGGVKAAEWMAQSILTDKVMNPHSLEYVEDDVKRVFSSGQAAMALNWTYMWDGANTPSKDTQIAGQIGVVAAPGPSPDRVGATNGSQPLCITSGSKHKDEAWDYIVFLTSQATQNAYATNSLPMWTSSYADSTMIAGRTELTQAAKAAFAAMEPRPTVVNYTQFSTILQQALQQVAAGQSAPQAALDEAAKAIAAAN